MTKLQVVAFCGLVIVGPGARMLLAEEEGIPSILPQIETNELSLASVIVEGAYAATEYDFDGQIVSMKKYQQYRFSRKDGLAKVEVQGEEIVPDKQSGNLVSIPTHAAVFYSPRETVYVDQNQKIAHKRPIETPIPFPLYWGYGTRYAANGQDIRWLSATLKNVLKERLLTSRKDAENRDLILLETTRDQFRFRYWIDPGHGYLLVRFEGHQLLPKPINRELLVEKFEGKPKKFDDHWFLETVRQERSDLTGVDPATMEMKVRRFEETLTVSSFRAAANLKPSDLEFSTNQFPQLKLIFDGLKGEALDPKTGKRIRLNGQGGTVGSESK